jgi:hypothetical protein
MTDGYKAKSFKGVPIAIEKHTDGSVTVCKEILEELEDALGKYPQQPDVARIRSILEKML